MEKLLDSMVIVARDASRNVRNVRMCPLTVLFTFTNVVYTRLITHKINQFGGGGKWFCSGWESQETQ